MRKRQGYEEYGKGNRIGAGRVALRCLSFVLVTLIIALLGITGLMFVLTHGPSQTAKRLFVMSVRETSAVGFLADIFVPASEIAAMEAQADDAGLKEATDSSLISIPERQPDAQDAEAIEILDVKGQSFKGKLMIVKDPSRVFLGLPATFGTSGQILSELVSYYDAVAGVNGGGFYDPGGNGNGGEADGIVISDGELLYDRGGRFPTAVMDNSGVLHVGDMTGAEAMALDARWAVSFGPVLVVNGTKLGGLSSGLNPRTAIGQREDGAVLLLVVDGRQIDSLGASYSDVADVMLEHGAVNALNLDGGSSTMMIYEGEELNTCASVVGPRKLPTSILVRRETGE